MNTTENNRLFLDFMGLFPHNISTDLYGASIQPWISVTGKTPESVMERMSQPTEYYESFNWLMQIVEKIEGDTGWELVMHSNDCYWNKFGERPDNTVDSFNGQRKQAVYNALVWFIKWYNKNNTRARLHGEKIEEKATKAIGDQMSMYAHLREFIYGWDFTERDGDENIILYSTKDEADKSLEEYIMDVNKAYARGDMDTPYENDCKVAEVDIYSPSDQPTTCPKCGTRTKFEQKETQQAHTCPNCKYLFIVELS